MIAIVAALAIAAAQAPSPKPHDLAPRCAAKVKACHRTHKMARERACDVAGGSWTCRTTAPIVCYCGEP